VTELDSGRTPSDLRIHDHPVLGPLSPARHCSIRVDDRTITAREGEPILAALWAAGIRVMGRTRKHSRPRSLFCGIGQCSDCLVTVDGRPNVPSCTTPVRDGMHVETEGRTDASAEL